MMYRDKVNKKQRDTYSKNPMYGLMCRNDFRQRHIVNLAATFPR